MDVVKPCPKEFSDSPCSEPGSMKRSPVEDDHTVADIKNISIEDHVLESPNSVSTLAGTLCVVPT